MKNKSFSLIEVILSLAIVALLVVMLSAALGGSALQFGRLNRNRDIMSEAEDVMEAAMAYEILETKDCRVKIEDYSEGLEQVEVFHGQTGKLLFWALRPKKSIYTP